MKYNLSVSIILTGDPGTGKTVAWGIIRDGLAKKFEFVVDEEEHKYGMNVIPQDTIRLRARIK